MPHRWLAVEAVRAIRSRPVRSRSWRAVARRRCAVASTRFPSTPRARPRRDAARARARGTTRTSRCARSIACWCPTVVALIVGFNPSSLWGLRQRTGRVRRAVGLAKGRDLFLPRAGEFIGHRRLRDWLQLLSFEIGSGRRGCYIPPLRSAAWLARFDWMEAAGERWWPPFGAPLLHGGRQARARHASGRPGAQRAPHDGRRRGHGAGPCCRRRASACEQDTTFSKEHA